MSLKIQKRPDGKAYPVFACNRCGQTIAPASEGVVIWRPEPRNQLTAEHMEAVTLHTVCVDPFVSFVGGDQNAWSTNALDAVLPMLIENSTDKGVGDTLQSADIPATFNLPTVEEARRLRIPVPYTYVRKARLARPEQGIAVGDPYFWWYDQSGERQFSKSVPAPEQYLWPQRIAVIEESRRAERLRLQEDERREAGHRQSMAWTRDFAETFFGGRLPRGSSEGGKAANWKPEDGGPRPREDARVFVCRETRNCPSRRKCLHVGGEPAEVAAYIQHLILSDRCTPYYEHMLWSVSCVESVQPFVVTLSASTMAGD